MRRSDMNQILRRALRVLCVVLAVVVLGTVSVAQDAFWAIIYLANPLL